MEEEIGMYLDEAKSQMDKAIEHTIASFSKIRAGKAMPNMVEGLSVDYYGTPTPITQVASVNTADARTLLIKPWEKNMIVHIEKSIMASDLGITPQNDGEVIRLTVPALTEERRQNLVKQVKNEAEHGRISIRNIRKEVNESLRKLQKEGAAEDSVKRAEDDVQKLTDAFVKKVDELFVLKEKDIMKV